MTEERAATPWLVLIYTVPRSPSRKRATVWRELKKAGAVYLRDGVCVLPRRDDTERMLAAIVEKVRDFEGQATIITAEHLDPQSTERVVADAGEARAEEYRELQQAAEQFISHVHAEREHRDFHDAELAALDSDLDKLRRWQAQIRARDYFPNGETWQRVETLLAQCDEALWSFVDDAMQETDERA